MNLDHQDQIALRAGEQAVLRTMSHAAPRRRSFARGLKREVEFDVARIEQLAASGYLEDLDGDIDASPERGRRRLVATERGRMEWRFAAAEDIALAAAMDDLFHRDGDVVHATVVESRYHGIDEEHPELAGPGWTRRDHDADPDDAESEAFAAYRREHVVEGIANHLGETLLLWNPLGITESHAFLRRPTPHSTAARVSMTVDLLSCLDAATRGRLHFQGGHTHMENVDGSRGTGASSSARNVLLRFGLVQSAVDSATRCEDFHATPRGLAFLAKAIAGMHRSGPDFAAAWSAHLDWMKGRVAA